MQVETKVIGERWIIEALRTDASLRPVNQVNWLASAVDGVGGTQRLAMEQVGLGRYRAEMSLEGRERVTLNLTDADFGLSRDLRWQRDYPREYRLGGSVAEELTSQPRYDAAQIRAQIPTERAPERRRTSYRSARHRTPRAGNRSAQNLGTWRASIEEVAPRTKTELVMRKKSTITEALRGEVPEWPNGTDSKSVVGVTRPGVRIPPSPPLGKAQLNIGTAGIGDDPVRRTGSTKRSGDGAPQVIAQR